MNINNNMRVVVNGKSENPTKINIQSGNFKLIIDEPENFGGTNDGPTPVQVLLMSLVGCLNITGHFVAKQQGLILNGMEIEVVGDMNPGRFMGFPTADRAGFKSINVNIKPTFENATEEQINNWLEETELRCPVTDNIKTKTNINVKIEELV